MSIRNITLICNASIGMSVALMIGFAGAQQWQKLNELERAGQSVSAVGELSNATIEMSLERSLTQVALNLDDPIAPEIEAMLLAQRKLSNELFDKAKQTVRSSTRIEGSSRLIDKLDDQLDLLDELRTVANRQFALPIEKRNEELIDSVPTEIKSVVSSVNKLISGVRVGFAGAPELIRNIDLAVNRAWMIREYGGRERTYFAIVTGRREALSRDALAYMNENHGKASQAWELLAPMGERTDTPPKLQAAIRTLGQSYFKDYNHLRDEVFAAGTSGEYPVSFEELFERSENALQTAITVVKVGVEANRIAVEEAVSSAHVALIIEGIAALIVASIIGFAIWFSLVRVVRPLAEMTDAMGRLARDDLSFDIPNTNRNDEIGAIAAATEVFKSQALDMKKLEEQQAENERQTRESRRIETERLADEFERTMGAVVESVGTSSSQLEQDAQKLAASAMDTGEQVKAVSSASNQSTANMESIAAAATELSEASQEIAQQVETTTQATRLAVGCTTDADAQVTALKQRADSIGEIVSMISEIAEQTNLLALNATIESARAGSAGSGFAVVAAEVKDLASQTAAAASDIVQQVQEIQNSTGDTVQAIFQIKEAIQKVEESSSMAAAAVQEQTVTITEISRNVSDASQGTGEVSQKCDGLSDGAASTGNLAKEMVEAARGLQNQSDVLHEKASGFLQQVRQSA